MNDAIDEMSALNRDLKKFFDEHGAAYPVWQALETEAGRICNEIRRDAYGNVGSCLPAPFMNIVNCAMLGAFILSMPQRPAVDRLTDYYAKAMMTAPMQWFCRKSGKSKFTAKDIAAMKATAALKAADRNPYSWNMEFYEYPDGSGYEGRFTKCGICVLMKELGLYDLTPALCRLDYTMSEAGGVTNFVRLHSAIPPVSLVLMVSSVLVLCRWTALRDIPTTAPISPSVSSRTQCSIKMLCPGWGKLAKAAATSPSLI